MRAAQADDSLALFFASACLVWCVESVGVVLDRCKKLTKVPLNNSVSVKRHILSCFATVKDAQRELMGEVSRQRELEGSNGQQGGEDDMNGHEEGGEVENGSDDDDDIMEEDTMTPRQLYERRREGGREIESTCIHLSVCLSVCVSAGWLQ